MLYDVGYIITKPNTIVKPALPLAPIHPIAISQINILFGLIGLNYFFEILQLKIYITARIKIKIANIFIHRFNPGQQIVYDEIVVFPYPLFLHLLIHCDDTLHQLWWYQNNFVGSGGETHVIK